MKQLQYIHFLLLATDFRWGSDRETWQWCPPLIYFLYTLFRIWSFVKNKIDLSNVDSFIVLVVEHLKRLNNLPLHLRGQHLEILAAINKSTKLVVEKEVNIENCSPAASAYHRFRCQTTPWNRLSRRRPQLVRSISSQKFTIFCFTFLMLRKVYFGVE